MVQGQGQEMVRMMQAEIHRLDRELQETRVSVGRLTVEVENHGDTLTDMKSDTTGIRTAVETLVQAETRRKSRDEVYDKIWLTIPTLAILFGGLYWLIEHTITPQIQEKKAYGAIHSPVDSRDGGGDVSVPVGGMGTPVR